MDKTFFWSLRVYYEDTDAQGVVYFANYFRFMERARTEWLRSFGIEQDELLATANRIFVVVDTRLKFLKPAKFNDQLVVSVVLDERTSASFVMRQEIFRDSPQGELLCSGDTRAACLAADTNKPARLPAQLTG